MRATTNWPGARRGWRADGSLEVAAQLRRPAAVAPRMASAAAAAAAVAAGSHGGAGVCSASETRVAAAAAGGRPARRARQEPKLGPFRLRWSAQPTPAKVGAREIATPRESRRNGLLPGARRRAYRHRRCDARRARQRAAVQADVIFDAEGRPRAIRPVKQSSK